VTQPLHNTDATLVALGFTADNDGTLRAPADSRVRLAPVGNFYELRISLGDDNAVVAVLAKSAVKITREGKPRADSNTTAAPRCTRQMGGASRRA